MGWIAVFSFDRAIVVLTRPDREDRLEATPAFLAARRHVALLSVPTAGISIVIGELLFHDWTWAVMLTLGTVATSFMEIGAGWLLAQRKMAWFVLYRTTQPALYVVSVVCVALILRSHTYTFRLNALAVCTVCALFIPAVVVNMCAPTRLKGRIDGRTLRAFAATTQLATSMQYLNNRLDLICLSVFSTPHQVGIYAVGWAAGQAASVLGNASFVRSMTGSDKKLDRSGLAMTILFGVVIAALSPLIIPRVFGSSFEASVPVAQILGIGAWINFALQAANGRLLGRGRPSLAAIAETAGAVAFGAGIAFSLNLEVVALADVGSYAVSLIVCQIFLRRGRFEMRSDFEP
jgi:O-antigen/teichoic acid export membrane protein